MQQLCPLLPQLEPIKGLKTQELIEIIIDQATIPVVIDAGLGSPSHAALAMELGADAVLVNTAIATATDPIAMATAFKLGVNAGRLAHLSGISPPQQPANASSPLTGFLHT